MSFLLWGTSVTCVISWSTCKALCWQLSREAYTFSPICFYFEATNHTTMSFIPELSCDTALQHLCCLLFNYFAVFTVLWWPPMEKLQPLLHHFLFSAYHSRAISFGNIKNPPALHWLITAILSVVPASQFKWQPTRWPQLRSVKEMAKWRSTWMNTQRRKRRKCDIKCHWLYQQLRQLGASNYRYLNFLETQHPTFCSTLH